MSIIKKRSKILNPLITAIISFIAITNVFAAERVVNLVVGYKNVNYAGKTIRAIAVNNQIPAPTLHFNEGDQVTINVYNHLNEETAIHWHGILVPWQMDGVLGVSQHGIQPGKMFKYHFKIMQSGTYWYHAHAGLQEQQGLYGAFIIDPLKVTPYKYNKDYVVVLSDWSNTHPERILANLKKDGDYYSPRFPLQPSLAKFIHDYRKANTAERQNLIDDYKMMQQMRMSIYDINDVAYDAFLLNGHSKCNPWTASVKAGDVVRLRFIGAGAETIFHIKIPGTTMRMVHIQGNDVNPYEIDNFTVAPGETYDVLVKIKNNNPHIIYAESLDTVGSAYGALTTHPQQFVNYDTVTPFPEPLPVTREMMANMMQGMNHGASIHSMSMNNPHSMMSHHHEVEAKQINYKHQNKNTMMNNMQMKHDMPMDNDNVNASLKTKSQDNSKQAISDSSSHEEQMMKSNQVSPQDNHSMMPNMKMGMPMNHDGMDMASEPKNNAMNKTSNHQMHMNHKSQSNMQMNNTMSDMRHMHMDMPTEPSIIGDKLLPYNKMTDDISTFGTKYQNLRAEVKTNNPDAPIAGVIQMELFGYMNHFIWMINGLTEYQVKPIRLEPGKRYRIIFTNNSMMRHPMHIHGHWFILRNGHDSYDPLLHTIEVSPGSKVIVDVDTDASGQWFFHCHMAYHMTSGMARVFQYSTLIEITQDKAKPQDIVKNTKYYNRPIVRVDEALPIDHSLVHHPMGHHAGLWLSTYLDVGADPFHNAQRLTYKGLYGSDYNKLELFTDDAELNKGTVENADIDVFYWHLISQFWAIKGGVNYFYRPATTPYWQPGIGIEGLMPYFIDTNLRTYYYGGSAKLDLELSRDTQITNNFFIRLGARGILASKTVTQAAIGNGLNQMRYIVRPYYRLMPGLNIFAEYEHEQDYGAFKNIQIANGEPSIENTLTFGLTILF